MLTPRQQIERFGKPIITHFVTPDVGVLLLKESYDRFAFCILSSTVPIQIRPVDGTGESFSEITVQTAELFTVHNLTHGLAVNLAWELRTGVGIGTITIIESFAFGSSIELERLKQSATFVRTAPRKSPIPSLPELRRSTKRKR